MGRCNRPTSRPRPAAAGAAMGTARAPRLPECHRGFCSLCGPCHRRSFDRQGGRDDGVLRGELLLDTARARRGLFRGDFLNRTVLFTLGFVAVAGISSGKSSGELWRGTDNQSRRRTSALAPIADFSCTWPHVREVPISDICGVAEANAHAMLAYRSAGTLLPLNGRYGPKGQLGEAR